MASCRPLSLKINMLSSRVVTFIMEWLSLLCGTSFSNRFSSSRVDKVLLASNSDRLSLLKIDVLNVEKFVPESSR